jgi:hypothetical protein
MGQRMFAMLDYLRFNTSVPRKLNEFAILIQARLWTSQVEWTAHYPIARGRAGPGLLAHVLFSKYGMHLPLNRQSDAYAREGIDLDVSTLADWVGACAATLMPLVEVIRAHVFAAGSESRYPVAFTARAFRTVFGVPDRPLQQ